MVFSSCNQQQGKSFDMLVFIDFNSIATTSFKISSTDTLYREKKLSSTTEYSYKLLSKSEKEKLNRLVDSLQNFERAERSFAIGSNQSVLYIQTDTSIIYYTSQGATRTPNFRELSNWFKYYMKDTGFDTMTKKIWNIVGIHEPPGPPIAVDSAKIID